MDSNIVRSNVSCPRMFKAVVALIVYALYESLGRKIFRIFSFETEALETREQEFLGGRTQSCIFV